MGSLAEKNFAPDWNKQHGSFAREAIGVAEMHDPYTRGKISGFRSYPSGKIVAL
jgi:hypothetical protein